MKNLFFLCAFLFMSMSMKAQLYIVHTYGEVVESQYNYFMTTVSPNGEVYTIDLPYLPDFPSPELMEPHIQIINAELNNIINQGYKLIHTDHHPGNNILGLNFNTYYLAVP